MYLCGWKYEGRKISDKLHDQILEMIGIFNDPTQVAGRRWPELQKYISAKLGIAPGQVRTIKRMMEEFGILKKGVLNATEVPDADKIYAEGGKTLIKLLDAEKLMRENQRADNASLMRKVKDIYQIYYQQVFAAYSYREDGKLLHPLRATLKAVKKFDYLDYWEWYLLNTVISMDDDQEEEAELERLIEEYRKGELKLKESDIAENMLSHSYVLGNFEYAGFVHVKGSKPCMKITLNSEAEEVIEGIIR